MQRQRRAAPHVPGADVSISETAYTALKRRILTNAMAPGSIVDEGAFARELGASRTPVREAILRLQGEGFLEIAPRRHIRVAPLSVEDMRQIYELLTAIELAAVQRLALRRPPEVELAPLRRAIVEMRRTLRTRDDTAWIDADERFHRGLLELCGNEYLKRVGLTYRDRIQRAHLVALRLRPRPHASVRAHAELLDMIAAGDVKRSRARHLEQRVAAGRELIDAVRRAGLTSL